MAPHRLSPVHPQSASVIWTPDLETSFYTNLFRLAEKNDEPCERVNYRGRDYPTSDGYVLKHEEEQHLADHLAFLACAEEGAKTVSAVTLEETQSPLSLTVRLASNETPSPKVVNDMRIFLGIVEDYARAGGHRGDSEEYEIRLFDEVVKMSQRRLHGRLISARWQKPPWQKHDTDDRPLHQRIQELRKKLESGSSSLTGSFASLNSALDTLVLSLKDLDAGSDEEQVELLKRVIRNCFEVSTASSSRSLERRLQRLGLGKNIYQNRTVLEMDKVSRYWMLCKDFIHFSQRSRTRKKRSLFENITLERCSAYHPAYRHTNRCYVHGEVQLVLYYEQQPKSRPPRAIGSSKSACFLCDLFIRNHGRYSVSNSHKRIYKQWTIPEVAWMSKEQLDRFRDIVRCMDAEMAQLIQTCSKKAPRMYLNGPESILQLATFTIVSSTASAVSQASDRTIVTTPVTARGQSAVPSPANSSTTVSSAVYDFRNLPISLSISASTLSFTLLFGEVVYIFELEEARGSHLLISKGGEGQTDAESSRINVRELSSSLETCVEGWPASSSVTFYFHDANRYELRVCLTSTSLK